MYGKTSDPCFNRNHDLCTGGNLLGQCACKCHPARDEMPTAIRVVVDAFHGKLVGVHGELDPRQVAS